MQRHIGMGLATADRQKTARGFHFSLQPLAFSLPPRPRSSVCTKKRQNELKVKIREHAEHRLDEKPGLGWEKLDQASRILRFNWFSSASICVCLRFKKTPMSAPGFVEANRSKSKLATDYANGPKIVRTKNP